jgi:transcriptional regulator with XRE-family HTH domain
MILDPLQLRYEMAIRGVDGQTLARVAGISKNTVTRALHGQPVNPGTLRRVTAALLTFPPLRMAEELVAKPEAQGRPRSPGSGPPVSDPGPPSTSASRRRGRPRP